MKVIFLTDSYLPYSSPNGLCVSKIAKELVNKNIYPTIITLKNKYLQPNISNEYGYTVNYLNPDWLRRLKYKNEVKNSKFISVFLSIAWKIKGILYGLFWPLLSISSVYKYYKCVNSIISKESDNNIVIISVYKQIEANIASYFIKKKYNKIKWIFYSLDAVSGSIIPKIYRSKRISMSSIKRWEKLIFNNADFLYLMEAHRNYYSSSEYSKYFNKIKYLDIPLVYKANLRQHIYNEKISFVYTGFMSEYTANPEYFLDLLNELDLDYEFNIYGSQTDYIVSILDKYIYVNILGTKSNKEILEIQQNADILLNFGNATPCAIPCKIFEYISSGRPIISFFKIDDDASLPYLKKYNKALLIDERGSKDSNVKKIKDFLIYLRSNYNIITDNYDIFKNNTPIPFIEELLKIK